MVLPSRVSACATRDVAESSIALGVHVCAGDGNIFNHPITERTAIVPICWAKLRKNSR
jgi:hypothetical protein